MKSLVDNLEIKRVEFDEIDEVVKVEEEAWPLEIRAPREKFESRMKIFSEGFLAAYVNGKMAALSTSQIIRYPNPNLTSWEGITDNGLIAKSHDANGNALYVVSLGVSSRFQGKGLGSKLVEAQKKLAKRLELGFLVLGARVPGYHRHPHLPLERYIELKRDDGETLDPEIRFYERCGLKIVQVVPNYMEDDPESLNYGAVMVWEDKS